MPCYLDGDCGGYAFSKTESVPCIYYWNEDIKTTNIIEDDNYDLYYKVSAKVEL